MNIVKVTILFLAILLLACCNPTLNSQGKKPGNGISNTINLLQGIWQSEEDSLAGLKIEKNKLHFTYKDYQVNAEDIYTLSIKNELLQFVKPTEKAEFLILTNSSDTLYYEILGLTEKMLSLQSYPSAKRSLYKRQ